MPSPHLSRRLLLPLTLLLAFPPGASLADVLRWDADGTFPPLPEDPLFGKIVDGSGEWTIDPLNLNWSADNGTTNTTWTNPATVNDVYHDAVFGNGGEFSPNVSLTGVVKVGNITFEPLAFPDSRYTVSGNAELRKTPPLSRITTRQLAAMSFGNAFGGGAPGFIKQGTETLEIASNSNGGFTFNPALDVSYDIQEGTVALGGGGTRSLFKEGVIRIAAGARLKLNTAQRIQDDRTVIRIEDGGVFDLNYQNSANLGTYEGATYSGAEKFGYLEGAGHFRLNRPTESYTSSENIMLHFGGGAETHTYSGTIGGSGSIFVDAANIKSYSVQEWTGANVFTGRLAVYNGTLAFSQIASLGFSSDPIISMGIAKATDSPIHGALRYTGAEALEFTRPLRLAATGTAGVSVGGGGFESSGTAPEAAVTFKSTIINTAGDKSFSLGGTHTGDNLFSSELADYVVNDGINPEVRYRASLLKKDSGTWRLTEAGKFTGGVEMNDGVLHLDNPGALNAEDTFQNSLRLHAGMLMLNGNSLTLGNGTPAGWGLAGAGGLIRNASPAAATLAVNNNSTAVQVFRGSIDNAGGGALSLVKKGSGTTTLSGSAQAYTGPTSVEAGTLRLQAVSDTLPVTSAAVWRLDASDASTITESGGLVSEWRDKSTGRRDLRVPVPAVAVPVSAPTYVTGAQNGLNAVRFDGVSNVLGATQVVNASTIFIVCSNPTNGDLTLKGGGVLGANGLGDTPDSAQIGIRGPRGGVWYGSGEGVDFATPAGSEFRVNGTLTTRVSPVAGNYWHTVTAVRNTAAVYNSVGGFPSLQQTGDNYWFRGDIGEIIVYSRVLTTEERSRVEAYLQKKWFGGTVSANILPVTTPVTVAAGATLDSGVPQTVASLDLSGSLKTGAPAGELVVSGTATLQPGSTLHWDVTDWTGDAGTGYDVLSAGTLAIAATAQSPVAVKIAQPALTNFAESSRTFTLARATAALTGFDAAKFTLDTSGFTAGTGTWSIQQTGTALELHYESAASPYDLWIAGYNLSPADALPAADPDGDGWANVLEFAVNGNPSNRSVSASVAERIASVSGEDAFTITVPMRSGVTLSGAAALTGSADGVTYFIEGSDSLSAWTLDIDEVSPALTAGLPALPTGWEYRTFRAPGPVNADAADFMRVRVQTP